VRALVRDPSSAQFVLPAAVALSVGDIGDCRAVAEVVEGAEVVVNAVGIPEQWTEDPRRFREVNADGTAVVVRAAVDAGARRLVHVSTVDVFEPGAGRVDEEMVAVVPRRSSYQRSKQLAEQVVLGAGGDIEVVVVNLAGLVGGRHRRPSIEDDLVGPLATGQLDVMLRSGRADTARAQRELGFQPRDLPAAIETLVRDLVHERAR
jgi:dihydroflavonol-4-reductase